jgi:uncharacterized protein involved in exopolysaccharide biosynthesis
MSEHRYQAEPPLNSSNSGGDNDDINLLDLAIIIAKHKKLIIGLPLACAVVAAIITLFSPNIYTANTKIIPVGGSVSREIIVSLLKSQQMTDSLIVRFDLQKWYGTNSLAKTRTIFSKMAKIDVDKDGLIDIKVEDWNASRAAAMANFFPSKLTSMLKKHALTSASNRRMLLERQLPEARQVVLQAEAGLNAAKQKYEIYADDVHVEELVKKMSEIKGQIAMKEIELFSIGTADPSRNIDYFKTREELSNLWIELSRVSINPDFINSIPLKQRDYFKKVGDLEYNRTRYGQLEKQIERARFEEAKDVPVIDVLDRAEVPDLKSRPRRTLIILVSFFTSAVVAVLWVMFSEVMQRIRDGDKDRFRDLMDTLHWK